ncbi:cytosine permease, partial [Burkholderia pseudomultivorans]
PNQLWVSDFTYVSTWQGWLYVAFVIAINLIDFYLVNNRHYRVAEIVSSNGGVYGAFNVKATAIYVFGIAVQVPFMEESFFHGPWASILGGADVSWMVGLVVTALVCYLFTSKDGSRSQSRCPAGAGALD